MTQEEKAKRYDEALEKARQLCAYPTSKPFISDLQDLFPELKESEDERIRKEIINYFECQSRDEPTRKDIHNKWIAWLEKHGEQETDEWKEGNIIRHGGILALVVKGRRAMKSNGELFTVQYPKEWVKAVPNEIECFLNELEKQGEQKSIDDLTQQEAMDIAVAKCFEQGEQKPTDEEMKEILRTEYEKGRADAIAEMQNTAWSEEDENRINRLIAYFEDKESFTAEDDVVYANWLKSIKDRVQPQPKQEWKQENTGDLTDFENAMMHIGGSFFGENAGLNPNSTDDVKEQAELLLSLVPKQEWSEEDERIRIETIELLETANHPNVLHRNGKPLDFTENINWLKSLRPQSQWKPSEEHLHWLKWAINRMPDTEKANEAEAVLEELLEQLKKLK